MALSKYDIELDLAQRQGTSHALLVELVGSNKRVLDVGCDTGYLGEALAALGCDVSGFEVNEVSAAEARKRLSRVEVGDLERTDLVELFGRAAFDVVIFGDVLEHLRDPLSVLRNSRGLLSPGGSVVISTPNIAHGDIRLALLQGKFNYTKLGILDETHTRFFTRDSLVTFLADAGFVLVDLRRTFADLFATEVDIAESDFDPAVVESVRADENATTYQFVLRAVPDDAIAITEAQALLVDELRLELGELQRRLGEVEGARAALAEELAQARTAFEAELGAVSAARDDLARQLAAPPVLTPTLYQRARHAVGARLRRRLSSG